MQTQKSPVFAALAAATLLAGCNGNPPDGSPAYKDGKLGNGGFLFECDDSVACDRWSTGSAKDFPDQIATGSTFGVRFVADGQKGPSIRINEKQYDGVVSDPIGPYLGSGQAGIVALKPGFGTIVARDGTGAVIDFATVKIVKPDALVVYEASFKGLTPPEVQAITMAKGQRQSYRTVAQRDKQAIAGSVRLEWRPADGAIVQIESVVKGVVNLVAKSPGKTKIVASGAGLDKEIDVEVTQ